jgi:hypothetical protein
MYNAQNHELVLVIFIALHSICMIPSRTPREDAKGENNIEATYNLHK